MVADAFAEPVGGGGAQRQRKVIAKGGDVLGVEQRVGEMRIVVHWLPD
jgi:hypothetical protein